ncbi:MAG: hypothetical protein PHH04_04270 [Thomasclavelia sp.]|nr:hypothetical protein [Thomasclavelia sp.]
MNSFLNNKKGSILQIVLVIFMALTVNILICLTVLNINYNRIKQAKINNITRTIEVMTIAHIKYNQANDILFSDEFTYQEYEVSFSVDDYGDDYYIQLSYQYLNNRYESSFKLDKDAVIIKEIKDL